MSRIQYLAGHRRYRGGVGTLLLRPAHPPSTGPHLVIVKEPHGGKHDFGSYLVWRKLE